MDSNTPLNINKQAEPTDPPTSKASARQRMSQTVGSVRNYLSSKKAQVTKVSAKPMKFLMPKVAPKNFVSLAKTGVKIDDRKDDFKDGIDALSKEVEEDPNSKLAKELNAITLDLFCKPARTQPVAGSLHMAGLPDPEAVFRDLLQSRGMPQENGNGTSSMTYAVGTLISLSLFNAGPNDPSSPYLDLSPLYGSNEKESDALRVKEGCGMLAPDCFYDDRAALLPNSVTVLLILLNRNHNYIAQRLLINDKGRKWIDPSTWEDDPSPADRVLSQDNEIFQKARMINCAHFRNIIMRDFMKGLLGMPTVGPHTGLDILADVNEYQKGQGVNPRMDTSFLYNFSHLMSQEDIRSFGNAIERAGKSPDDISPADYEQVVDVLCKQGDRNPRRRDHAALRRGPNAYFKDDDLARILYDVTETPSVAPGSGVPASMKPLELKAIHRAREGNVCSLNEYRKHLGLKPYTSFQEWNPDSRIAQAAKNLYGSIDKLELYPGLQAEEVARGRGFGLGYTTSYALLVDLTYRIRNDPKLTIQLNEHNVTKWGVEDCDPKKHIGSGTGTMLPRIFQRTLPRNYPFDSLYTLFPFSTPSVTVEDLPKWPKITSYIDRRPEASPIINVTSKDTISYIFNNPEKYPTPYGPDLKQLTKGYGFFLGFDDPTRHDRDQIMMLYALIPDKNSLSRYARMFRTIATEYIQDRSVFDQNTGRSRVDVIGDVINAVCTRWVCETLCDYKLSKDDVKRRKEEQLLHEKLASLFLFVFRNIESEAGWDIRKRALEYSEELRDHLLKEIPKPVVYEDKHYVHFIRNSLFAIFSFTKRWVAEVKGKNLSDETAQTFLMRLLRASHSISIEDIRDHEDIQKFLKENDFQDEILEKSRLVANILGLAVVTAVSYSQVCGQAVSYYLAPERSEKLKEIIEICTSLHPKPHDNVVLMGFIREAQIADQKLGLWRNVAAVDTFSLGNKKIDVHPGDRIYANITAAHQNLLPIVTWSNNEKGEKTYTVKPISTIQGMGLHKCAGISFVDQTMPEIFRAIFRLPDIRSQQGGQLVKVKALLDFTETTPDSFLNSDGTTTYYPKNLVIEYGGKPEISMRKKKQERWKLEPSATRQRCKTIMNLTIPLVIIFFVLVVVLRGMLFVRDAARARRRLSDKDVQHEHVDCPDPTTDIHPWQNNLFIPAEDGHPRPIEYTLDLPVAHRLSFVDIDKKDVRMSVEVDDVLRGFARDFALNKSEDCGENIGLCLSSGFSAGLVVIPPGKHTVRIAWQGKENLPEEWGDDKFRRIFWHRAKCGAQRV